VKEDSHNPACEVPVNCVPGEDMYPEPEICTCVHCPCPPDDTLTGSSLEGYTHSYTPVAHGVELATGKLRQSFPVAAFATRLLGFAWMRRESHVRFWESGGVRFPSATRPIWERRNDAASLLEIVVGARSH
jgi:hypothetical protein